MPQVTIENPIVNGPFEAPARHFRFDDDGITNDIIEKRRRSALGVRRGDGPVGRAAHDQGGGAGRAGVTGQLVHEMD